MKTILYTLILLSSFYSISNAQTRIHFRDATFEEAKELAKELNKKIFIDTYASWCTACKVLDKDISQDRKLIRYFNDHFINIKIDMNGPDASTMQLDYDVVFLPTLLFLDADGEILFRSDRKISTKELYESAQRVYSNEQVNIQPIIMAGHVPPKNEKIVIQKPINTPPVKVLPKEEILVADNVESPVIVKTEPRTKSSKTNLFSASDLSNSEEKILYVLGSDKMGVRPDFLYQEAYFRLQFGDGSHRDAYTQYLSSQPDWSSDRNIRFIYDFVYDTRSKAFDYMIKNRELFVRVIGEENLNKSISLLIKERINQGYPRPELDEALELYALLDTQNFEKPAYEYYLERLYSEECFDEYLERGQYYIDEIDASDHQVMHRIGYIHSEYEESKEKLTKSAALVSIAINHHKSAEYYDTLAYLYYKLGNKSEAYDSAQKAIDLAMTEGKSTKAINELMHLIRAL